MAHLELRHPIQRRDRSPEPFYEGSKDSLSYAVLRIKELSELYSLPGMLSTDIFDELSNKPGNGIIIFFIH